MRLWYAVDDLAALVRYALHQSYKRKGRFIELRDRYLVVRVGHTRRRIGQLFELTAALATGTVKDAEVSIQHGRGRHVAGDGVGGLAGACSLVAAKKEELVAEDWSADRAAELIAFERILLGRKVVARVQVAITKEVKHGAVKAVAA